MATNGPSTVEAYLADLPDERRNAISAVRDVILANLPEGYRESLNWGMISYEIPLERYPDTYNKQPLSYIALGSQKNHMALYLMCVYGNAEREAWLRESFDRAGKKLDMGKSCLRFKRLEELPLDVIGEIAATATPEEFIVRYEESRKR